VNHLKKTWCINGYWGANTFLINTGGELLGAKPKIPLEPNLKGEKVLIKVEMVAPNIAGRFLSYWRLVDSSGKHFGNRLWTDIVVPIGKSTDDNNVPAVVAQVVENDNSNNDDVVIVQENDDDDDNNNNNVDSKENVVVDGDNDDVNGGFGIKDAIQYSLFGKLGYQYLNNEEDNNNVDLLPEPPVYVPGELISESELPEPSAPRKTF